MPRQPEPKDRTKASPTCPRCHKPLSLYGAHRCPRSLNGPTAYASSETAYGRTVAYPFAIKVF